MFQECPGGIVQEDTFKEIYAKFFPHGSRRHKSIRETTVAFNKYFRHFPDSSLYAHHVFKAFDANRNGSISFRVSLTIFFEANSAFLCL